MAELEEIPVFSACPQYAIYIHCSLEVIFVPHDREGRLGQILRIGDLLAGSPAQSDRIPWDIPDPSFSQS